MRLGRGPCLAPLPRGPEWYPQHGTPGVARIGYPCGGDEEESLSHDAEPGRLEGVTLPTTHPSRSGPAGTMGLASGCALRSYTETAVGDMA